MALSNESKASILTQNISMLENTVYNLEVTAKVNIKVGDTKGSEETQKQLVEIEKKLSAFNKLLAEVKAEDAPLKPKKKKRK